MELFLFLYALEIGYAPNYSYNTQETNLNSEVYYVELTPEIVLLELIHINGTLRVDMFDNFKSTSVTFNPISISSLFDIYIEYKFLTIGFRHLCAHPIIAWAKNTYPMQDMNRSYDQFYIKISNKYEEGK